MRYPKTVGAVLLATIMILAGEALFVHAQTDTGSAPPAVLLDEADMEQLVAPIALYPDPLLAQVLPASTYPLEIQSAANWLQANPNPSEAAIDAQAVEPSIKALLHYPAVLQMMNSQIDWTQELGVAFLNQQPDVMNAIQTLRARAQSEGALVSGPQEQVTSDDDGIEILPTDPNVMYVPEYDPDTIYVGDGGEEGYITFGTGYPCGVWLDNNFDWHNHRFGVGGGWNHGWPHPVKGKPPVLRTWERNRAQPIPVMKPGAKYSRPGYEDPKEAHPENGAFGGYQKGTDVQRAVGRTEPNHAAPAPAPREEPKARPASPPPARSAPAPARPAPAKAAPSPAFHDQGGGKAASAQSERGHASMAPHNSGGGGGGGGGKSGGRK